MIEQIMRDCDNLEQDRLEPSDARTIGEDVDLKMLKIYSHMIALL